jgi:hypothetical protein
MGILAMAGGVLAIAALTSAGMASGCHVEPNPEYFEGGALGYCSGFAAKPITAGECRGCSGGAFALCNGNSFNECTCELPVDYSLDAGTFAPDSPVITEAGPRSSSFEAGGLVAICCEGNMAREIPSANCPLNCPPLSVAWALCEGNAWAQCACSMPPGFVEVPPGYICDGG